MSGLEHFILKIKYQAKMQFKVNVFLQEFRILWSMSLKRTDRDFKIILMMAV